MDVLTALTDYCSQGTFRADGAGEFGGSAVMMNWDYWWYHLCHKLLCSGTCVCNGLGHVHFLDKFIFLSRLSRPGLSRPCLYYIPTSYHAARLSRLQAFTPSPSYHTTRAITSELSRYTSRCGLLHPRVFFSILSLPANSPRGSFTFAVNNCAGRTKPSNTLVKRAHKAVARHPVESSSEDDSQGGDDAGGDADVNGLDREVDGEGQESEHGEEKMEQIKVEVALV